MFNTSDFKVTPFVLLATILMCTSLYHLIFPGPYKMGMLAFFYLFPVALILFVVDYLGQHFASSYARVATAEVVLIVLMACGYVWTQRTSTFLLPEAFDKEHIVVVHGVENTPKLISKGWLATYNIRVPASGVILTSSEISGNLKRVQMKKERADRGSSDFEKIYGTFADSFEVKIGDSLYECNTWMISRNGTISYSSDELQEIQGDIRQQLIDFLKHIS